MRGVLREKKMLKGHLPKVIYHQVYLYAKMQALKVFSSRSAAVHVLYRGNSIIRNSLPQDPTVGLCLGPCGGPKGVDVVYERGTPAHGR